MEEFVAFVAEMLLEFLVYSGFDGYTLHRRDRRGRTRPNWFFYFLVGGALGGLSLLVFPRPWVVAPSLRLTYLFASPTVGGALSLLAARLFGRRDPQPWSRFGRAFGCLFAYGLVRFVFAKP
jgi:hypothetical protein